MPLKKPEGRKVPLLGDILFWLYRFSRRPVRWLIVEVLSRLENERYSVTLRRIASSYHNVEVGMYTRVQVATRGAVPSGTKIGRYCSITRSARVFGASHPTNTRSSHAFFYNPFLGYAKHDFLRRTQPNIGNDVYIGHNAIVTNKVTSIGDGAYIAAGAVVTKDVPPYAIVAGNPARILRYRFSEETVEELLKERWWEKSIDELGPDLREFQNPLEGDEIR